VAIILHGQSRRVTGDFNPSMKVSQIRTFIDSMYELPEGVHYKLVNKSSRPPSDLTDETQSIERAGLAKLGMVAQVLVE